MASIISQGIGSGLDIAGLVQQLVTAEAAPVETRIARQEARVQSKLSAFGSLKGALSDFQDRLDKMRDLDTFLTRKAGSGNEDLFTVTVDKDALPADYSVEVVQLAQAQKLTSGSFTGSDAVVGTGTLLISVGADSFNITIDDDNNTLAAIRDAINEAVDNTGVAATIVNADAGSYLILTGEDTGAASTITVTQSGGDGGLASLEYDPGQGLNSLTETIAAQDALVRIDGFDVQSNNNSIVGAIDGVTLDLITADPGNTTSLGVDNDTDAVLSVVNDFADKYNALVAVLDEISNYNAETERGGPLIGDTTVRSIRDQIRRELSTAVTDIEANFGTLAEVGIELQLDGSLSVDGSKVSDILAQDFTKFGQLFAASDGFAVRIYDITDNYLKSGGILETRTNGLNAQVEDFSDQRESLADRLVTLEARLLRQFNALDSLLGELTQTSTFLNQQLSSLPGFTNEQGGR